MPDIASRFSVLTEEQTATPLAGAFAIRSVGADEWSSHAREVLEVALPREYVIDGSKALSPDEMAEAVNFDSVLSCETLQHHFLFEREGELVGVYRGLQDFGARYYMACTAILPAFQRCGLYSAFLERLISIADGTGFGQIYSRHHADNNTVIVPKLKRGFVIAAFEVSPRYGLLIELRRYRYEGHQRLHRYRV